VTPAKIARPAARPSLAGHRSAYLVGIGGTGMSGAAELLRARGLEVRGCERTASRRTARLDRVGVVVDPDDGTVALPVATTLVVASAAVPDAHPLLLEARRRRLPVWKYAECLGALMDGRTGIAVAGCHGKTTTTALVATALWRAGRDPSFVVGGEVRDLATSARPGRGEHFVAEACEFDRSFHRLRPRVALVTNVDADHLDYYRDLDEIRESFRAFARLLPADGALVVHEEHAAVFEGDPALAARVETYGFSPSASWRATDPWWDGREQALRWRVERAGRLLGPASVPLSGLHNVLNATGALAALAEAGLSFEESTAAIASFGGVARRLERVGEARGVTVLDDYGHHPAEIRSVVRALRTRFDGRRVVVVFQPHQASRTRHLLDDFGKALAEADEAWLAPIYFARDGEEERRAVCSEDVVVRVRAAGGKARAFDGFEPLIAHAVSAARPGDVVVTMGAGDVDEVARGLARRLR
jgi:UDP-N-acetylmuramate--alanine ligase